MAPLHRHDPSADDQLSHRLRAIARDMRELGIHTETLACLVDLAADRADAEHFTYLRRVMDGDASLDSP